MAMLTLPLTTKLLKPFQSKHTNAITFIQTWIYTPCYNKWQTQNSRLQARKWLPHALCVPGFPLLFKRLKQCTSVVTRNCTKCSQSQIEEKFLTVRVNNVITDNPTTPIIM